MKPECRTIILMLVLTAVTPWARAQLAQTQDEPQTTSQASDEQLNQLFLLETTPNKSAAGEGYIDGQFRFLKFPGSSKQYLLQIQGQYSVSDQLAVGGWLPVINDKDFDGSTGSNTGVGDLTFYAQYKLDQFVSHDFFDLTAEGDLVLPTGSEREALGEGHLGFRPSLLAYKAFDLGPGTLGAYGSAGVTLTTDLDFRLSLAATYDYDDVVTIFEFDDITGRKIGGKPFVAFTPGVAYRGYTPWEFALGFPLGANSDSPDWGVVLKVTYAFQH